MALINFPSAGMSAKFFNTETLEIVAFHHSPIHGMDKNCPPLNWSEFFKNKDFAPTGVKSHISTQYYEGNYSASAYHEYKYLPSGEIFYIYYNYELPND